MILHVYQRLLHLLLAKSFGKKKYQPALRILAIHEAKMSSFWTFCFITYTIFNRVMDLNIQKLLIFAVFAS